LRAADFLSAARGVAVRELPLKAGHGKADYVLYVDYGAIGAIEAKKQGSTLTGVETQSGKYSQGLPENLPAWHRPLPFLYESTGADTQFTNLLDPKPRTRQVFAFHRPETLLEAFRPPGSPVVALPMVAEVTKPSPTLRERLTQLPPLVDKGLWPVQARAFRNLEESLAKDHRHSAGDVSSSGNRRAGSAPEKRFRNASSGAARRSKRCTP
jgi:type I restriction enzyme R subunit